MSNEEKNNHNKKNKIIRGVIKTLGGAIPFAGGLFSTVTGAWSEQEQEKQNIFFQSWIDMLKDEIREKEKTIIEIMARLDMLDKAVADRVTSNNYQAIVKKAFREWAGVESEEKRVLVRNVLTNSAMTKISSDDVVRLFIDWINKYSEFHFSVVSSLYNSAGKTRSQIWNDIGRGERVREDSADADLYKLLIDDLTIGRVIRQARETDDHGNFIKQNTNARRGSSGNIMKSAFDDEKSYVLTELGKQFIHYAKNEIVPRIEYSFNDIENE